MNRRSWRQITASLAATMACGGAALATAPAPLASAASASSAAFVSSAASASSAAFASSAASASSAAPASSAPRASYAQPGANLILNPGAEAGAYSGRGWDAVTIPGWQVLAGLPTVVRYGAPRFPRASGPPPGARDGQLFAGGAGGTAVLRQVIALRPGGRAVRAGVHYRLSAWLGGDKHSGAAVTVTFRSVSGRILGHQRIGPVDGHGSDVTLARRSATGMLPAGTATAAAVLTLTTTLKNDDGPYAPYAGYNRGSADDLRFSVSVPLRRPLLTAPAVRTPRYQHVFLFYFENEDYRSVIGNTRLAPFLNSLLPHASLLADMFAEEHPSDGNYLALAGGSAFGIPLTDPLEENSQYTIHARNIGDLVDSAHKTWKTYLQSANGPCDDTVHGRYWDDDMPMTYFADVRGRPGYCSAHLVPLQALQADLSSTASTPNFAWIAPDDCADMEGCGIRDGDNFLATELGQIMASPAWRTQRSLAIITWDEDGYDHEHPAQRVATVMIGSAGVRQGYVSHVRYTHYSLLRTIEGVLGLGTLTANDRYAQAVNDVFGRGTAARLPARSPSRPGPAGNAPAAAGSSAVVSAGGHGPRQQTAFVVNSASGTVTPVNLVTRHAGRPIPVGKDPQAIAITPDGGAAYVVDSRSASVTPINTVTRKAGAPIRVGADPQGIVITPDGRTAYVTDAGANEVTPVDLRTGQPEAPIHVGVQPHAIAITPDGRTAFVLDWGGSAVTPISVRSGHAGRPIPVGSYPVAITIAPGGATAYVASFGSDTVTPIRVASRRAGQAIPAGQAPDALAITPDGGTVFAVGGDSDSVIPITAATRTARPAVRVGSSPDAVAVADGGRTAFVVNTIPGTVTPVSVASGHAGKPIPVAAYSYPTAISVAPSGPIAVVIGTYGGEVTLLDTSTGKAVATVTVGSYPVAAAIAP
ncbi:MAG: alkaline phosphatase family protein [Streptosporangiaceae bacterium]